MIAELQEKRIQEEEIVSKAICSSNVPYNVIGLKMRWIHLKLKFSLLRIAMSCYNNPINWFLSLHYLVKLRRRFLGNHRVQKMVLSGGKYYMGLYTPGWNSSNYKQFIRSQLNDFKPIDNGKANRFNNVFVAITKKCVLQCDHCYEWDNLNKRGSLTEKELQQIIKKLQDKGVSQIQLSGGEPLLEMDTLVNLLCSTDDSTDFWLATSGYKLTNTNAQRLKKAGLTGVIVSLDHFSPKKHNDFRHFKDAYYWVEEAIKNANSNNLTTVLSLCATKEFISEENLISYMELAKKLKVAFVQVLEPKAVGHYAHKDVSLTPTHIKILENLFIKMNFQSEYNSYPIITYHGYYQRRQGCYSAGQKGIYIDTDGDMNACPFCHKKTGNVLDTNFDQNLYILKSEGCPSYPIN